MSAATPPTAAVCVRCKSPDPTVHFRDTSYCAQCFDKQFTQKAKAGFELARGAGLTRYIALSPPSGPSDEPVNVDAHLALGFSGGMSSRALLSAARLYFRPPSQVQGRTSEVSKVHVLFVDDSAVVPGGVDRTQEARQLVQGQGEAFEFIALKLEDVFDGDTTALQALFQAIDPADAPRTAKASARTRGEDLHRVLTMHLLRREAKRLGCAALMLGENGTRSSIRLIESLAKGGGHKLAVEGSDAVWIDDLLVVRPLKSHLIQEVAQFARSSGLSWLPEQEFVPSAVKPGDQTPSGEPVMDKSSIARLTETFILNLEKGVPSTVSTIGRTGSKLVLKTDTAEPQQAAQQAQFQVVGPSEPLLGRKARKAAAKENGTPLEPRIGARASRLAHVARNLPRWEASKAASCPLCEMPAKLGAKDWKNDITISLLDDALPVKQQHHPQTSVLDLPSLLCYSCILTLDTDRPLQLPPYVLLNAQRRITTKAIDGLTGFPLRLDDDDSDKRPQESTQQQQPRKVDRHEMKASIDQFLLE